MNFDLKLFWFTAALTAATAATTPTKPFRCSREKAVAIVHSSPAARATAPDKPHEQQPHDETVDLGVDVEAVTGHGLHPRKSLVLHRGHGMSARGGGGRAPRAHRERGVAPAP